MQGTITVDGELANRGRVVFHPVGDGPSAYGNIFENGTYSLRVGQGDLTDVDGGQLQSGEYIVTVVVNMPSAADEAVGQGGAPTPGARLTAAKYADKATSDLRATVKPGPNVLPLEVAGASADEVVEEVVEAEDDLQTPSAQAVEDSAATDASASPAEVAVPAASDEAIESVPPSQEVTE